MVGMPYCLHFETNEIKEVVGKGDALRKFDGFGSIFHEYPELLIKHCSSWCTTTLNIQENMKMFS